MVPTKTVEAKQATLIIETIGKWGIKSTDGVWYGLKKPLQGTDFVVGTQYDVLLEGYETKAGKTGDNIVQVTGYTAVVAKKATTRGAKKASSPSNGYAPRDFQAEARGKVTSNAYNSPLLPSLIQFAGTDYDEYMKLVDETVAHISKKVWESQK